MNDFHVISNDTALVILTAAWRILKRHYEILLGSSLFILGVLLAMEMVPYVKVLSSIPIAFLSVGQMHIIRKLIEGKPAVFTDLFRAFENQQWMRALLPLAVSGVGIALLQKGLSRMLEGGALAGFVEFWMNLTLMLIWVALTAFSGPLIVFKDKAFAESIELNLRATTANWQPLLVFSFYLLGIIVFSALCFLLPLFFIGLPVIFVSGYLTYACLFENLKVEELAERFKETKQNAA